ncbi:MAG: hypothetical protein H6624_00650 [Bdellovibrionaceae bacterium]|nr:hypothetical protein [Bdellovibrionales bacterium]MCB9082817.1 hypothetical protein [Pseudobdellovibrionaceae bacterium]
MLRVLLAIDDYGEMVYLQTLMKKLGFDVDGVQSQRAFAGKQLGFNPQVVLATANGRRVNGIELAESTRRPQGIPQFILLIHPQQRDEIDFENLKNVDGHLESPVNVQKLLEIIANVGGVDAAALMEKYNRMKASLQPDEEGDLTILKGDSTGPIDPDPTMPPHSASPSEPSQDVTLIKGEKAESEAQYLKGEAPGASQASRSIEEELEAAGELSLETGQNQYAVEGLPSEVREARFRKYLDELPEPTENGFTREKVVAMNKELRRTEDTVGLKDLEEERQGFVKQLFTEGKNKKKS